eukprot:CAMPEP_0168511366 /NCGR_PEP_ID=MMETSP0405-20121227/2088_1 /TAXON_ID=498012 /ORGANISM="Trichosphaerium sp, Strain Am-I-7 wt" /LENGTH=145 /DNA_ID=CAMNT_0008529521 /DNA_START=93 /DNA_END=526 /DNA_ORIENTATION=-
MGVGEGSSKEIVTEIIVDGNPAHTTRKSTTTWINRWNKADPRVKTALTAYFAGFIACEAVLHYNDGVEELQSFRAAEKEGNAYPQHSDMSPHHWHQPEPYKGDMEAFRGGMKLHSGRNFFNSLIWPTELVKSAMPIVGLYFNPRP